MGGWPGDPPGEGGVRIRHIYWSVTITCQYFLPVIITCHFSCQYYWSVTITFLLKIINPWLLLVIGQWPSLVSFLDINTDQWLISSACNYSFQMTNTRKCILQLSSGMVLSSPVHQLTIIMVSITCNELEKQTHHHTRLLSYLKNSLVTYYNHSCWTFSALPPNITTAHHSCHHWFIFLCRIDNLVKDVVEDFNLEKI